MRTEERPKRQEGDPLHLPQSRQHTVQAGQPAPLMLLKPLKKQATCRIERIIRFDG